MLIVQKKKEKKLLFKILEQEEIIEGLSADDSQLLQDYINRSINYGK